MNIYQTLILIAFSIVMNSVFAQSAERAKANYPETEIFLFDLNLGAEESALANGRNVTNRAGYDNQPYFTNDSKSFVYSRGDDYQTDVYEYLIDTKQTKQLTHSDATEFSPTPFADNKSISFVSDRSASIWHGTRDELDNPKWALASNDNREPIGYYAWNHTTGDILYWSQYGFSVSLVHESSKNYHFISGHAVPSTPHIIPGTNKFSFVHQQTNGQVWIKEFDPVSKATRPITPVVGSNANYAWAPDGSILMIEKDTVFRWTANLENEWTKITSLSEYGIHRANRLAISPNGKLMAVVGLPTEAQSQ